LKLLLDELVPPALVEALRTVGIEAHSASELGLAGRSDPDILAAAIADGLTVLTENVADFARISAQHLLAGEHHHGVLIALSSRFSRRPAGVGALVASIRAVQEDPLEDRVVYLRPIEASEPRARRLPHHRDAT
jgi:predicted nuclease of predicted toxin-antitoxin system